MLKKVIFSNSNGMGLITSTGPTHPKIVQEKVTLHGVELSPGDATTLDGFFDKNVFYAGILISKNQKVMCFYIGKDSNLFEEKHYYYCLIHLNENLIVNKYTHTSARPFTWTGSCWK